MPSTRQCSPELAGCESNGARRAEFAASPSSRRVDAECETINFADTGRSLPEPQGRPAPGPEPGASPAPHAARAPREPGAGGRRGAEAAPERVTFADTSWGRAVLEGRPRGAAPRRPVPHGAAPARAPRRPPGIRAVPAPERVTFADTSWGRAFLEAAPGRPRPRGAAPPTAPRRPPGLQAMPARVGQGASSSRRGGPQSTAIFTFFPDQGGRRAGDLPANIVVFPDLGDGFPADISIFPDTDTDEDGAARSSDDGPGSCRNA